eukprot:CAMPEP_0197006968 /NCGR_PEP_ID=MMETSP1380-20130617/38263_1 /TAXON_ID=5936 /ORGANISM="Euplotes crassus, Strain CT5" /LENGTH=200 /DNA_ID=CAMNT_0042426851 /DNA_START=122 /DNA_END=725 /DNA_ORIENTATION=+
MSTSSQGVTSKLNQAGSLKDSTYGYILMKALKNPTDITPNEKMILVSHPVIAELIEQTNGMKHTQKLSCYVNIDTSLITNIATALKSLFFMTPMKSDLFNEEQVLQYTPPQDEEKLSDSTKGYSDKNLIIDEDDKRTIGKYTLKERKQKIRKYKEKLKRYRLGLSNTSNKYKKRSIIAKTRPRIRGKFVKNSQSAELAAR